MRHGEVAAARAGVDRGRGTGAQGVQQVIDVPVVVEVARLPRRAPAAANSGGVQYKLLGYLRRTLSSWSSTRQ